jgi:redox-sensitive bicupin YhaK (pirin superfamily)
MKQIGLVLLGVMSLNGGEMIAIRKSEDRGAADHGWLSTHYTFSFSDYYDPNFMGFRTLRVMNEDVVEATKGFDTHPHDNMEILTYVLDGSLEHKDTMGNHSQIKKGEFQLMTAGTGIKHSEFNPSKKDPVHLLQIWIVPEKKGLKPEYQQKNFADHIQGLKLVVSPEGKEGSLKIHQDARIYLGRFESGQETELPLSTGRHAWVQVVRGNVSINGTVLKQGDGASVSGEKKISIRADQGSEFLLFDLS